MLDTAGALDKFYNGFDIPAFTINTVPDDVDLPYITYSLVETEPLEPSTHYAQVWYRGTTNEQILRKVDQIKKAIGKMVLLDCDEGYVAIRPANPFVQLNVDETNGVRQAYINMQINCYHL